MKNQNKNRILSQYGHPYLYASNYFYVLPVRCSTTFTKNSIPLIPTFLVFTGFRVWQEDGDGGMGENRNLRLIRVNTLQVSSTRKRRGK